MAVYCGAAGASPSSFLRRMVDIIVLCVFRRALRLLQMRLMNRKRRMAEAPKVTAMPAPIPAPAAVLMLLAGGVGMGNVDEVAAAVYVPWA